MSNKTVIGLIVMTYRDLKEAQDGMPPAFIKSTFPEDELNTGEIGVKLASLALTARDLVRDLDHTNDLNFVKISLKKFEFMVCPDKNYCLIVKQEPDADAAQVRPRQQAQ